MRKMKKINGFLIVRFNDRELREWKDTGLGNYGVIDAELYTGQLEIDRSVMEFDGAETLQEAVEQARGLEAELDVEEPEVTVTVIKETDDNFLVAPDTFSHRRETFEHLPDRKQGGISYEVYALGLQLSGHCPMNDCHLYLNVFNICREIDDQIENVDGWPRKILEMELEQKYLDLERMFTLNYAVRKYRNKENL